MACLAVHLHGRDTIDLAVVRRMVLGSLRKKHTMFREYGEVVLAADSDAYWRTVVFPHYKAHRRKDSEGQGRDPDEIRRCINVLCDEFRDNLPYTVLRVHGCEADDVVAVLVNYNNGAVLPEKVVIVSADHDFIQLHSDRVSQYDPIKKKDFVVHRDPDAYLLEHVMRGDPGDGIPNVLSSADSFVVGKRQVALTRQRLKELCAAPEFPSTITLDILARIEQNALLIDFSHIPEELHRSVITEWKKPRPNNRDCVLQYFAKHRLNSLVPEVNDFL